MTLRDYRFFPLACGLIFAAGCGDGRPSMDTTKNETKVSGTVKIQGKLAQDGEISFNPSNADRQVGAFVAKIGPDGTYSVTTFTGANIVRFNGAMLKEHPELALSSRYYEVTSGENVVDFDLLGEGDKARGPTYSRKQGAIPKKR